MSRFVDAAKCRTLRWTSVVIGILIFANTIGFAQQTQQSIMQEKNTAAADQKISLPRLLRLLQKAERNLKKLYNDNRSEDAISLAKKLYDFTSKKIRPFRFPETEDGVNFSIILHNIGIVFYDKDEFQVAYDYLKLSVEIINNFPDFPPIQKSKITSSFGDILYNQGKYTEAQELQLKVLKLWENNPEVDDLTLSIGLNKLAETYRSQAKYDEAHPMYLRALQIRKSKLPEGDPRIAEIMNNLALLENSLGNLHEAIRLQEQTAKDFKDSYGINHPQVAISLSTLAGFYYKQGDFFNARRLHEQALKIKENILKPGHPQIATSFNNLALVLSAQGDYTQALCLHEKALSIAEQAWGSNHPEVAGSLNNLGEVLLNLGEYGRAGKHFKRALQIKESVFGPTHPSVAVTLHNLAMSYEMQGKFKMAHDTYKKVIKLKKQIWKPNHPEVAVSLNNLGVFLRKQGLLTEARSKFEHALGIINNTAGQPTPYAAFIQNNLGILNWQEKRIDQARVNFLDAGNIINDYTRSILSTLSFTEKKEFINRYIQEQISITLSSHAGTKFFHHAYPLIYQWKGLLVESIRQQSLLSKILNQDAQYTEIFQRLQSIRVRIASWYHESSQQTADQWINELKALTEKKEATERELAQFLVRANIKDPLNEIDWKTFQSLLLPGEVFIDIYHYTHWDQGKAVENRYAAVIVSSEHVPKVVDLGSANDIEQVRKIWRKLLLRNKHDERKAWQRLSELTWNPIAKYLPDSISKVWVSPDSQLSLLPWHLLPQAHPKTRQLMLTQINSAREWVRLRLTAPPFTREPTILLVGGVDFNAGPAEFGRSAIFREIQGTRNEIENIERFARLQQILPQILTDAAASKQNIFPQLPKSSYVHLATHGFFRSFDHVKSAKRSNHGLSTYGSTPNRNPLVTAGLALAGANVHDATTQAALGLLTAEEIVGLDMSQTALVTLSACNTGRGELTTGQGVLGLRAAVMATGARTLLMSLWRVPDVATEKFMTTFYTHIWTKKLSPAQALQHAVTKMRKEPKFAAPVNWAGWALVGEAWSHPKKASYSGPHRHLQKAD